MNALSVYPRFGLPFAMGLRTIETRGYAPPKSCIGERFLICTTRFKNQTDIQETMALLRPYGFPLNWEYLYAREGAGVASGVLTGAVPTDAIAWRGDLTDGPANARSDQHGWLTPGPAWRSLLVMDDDDHETIVSARSEQAWGDFSPGRWAWLFSELARVEDRCPRCWGNGRVEMLEHCPVCEGAGKVDPFPVRGRQRVWQWERTGEETR